MSQVCLTSPLTKHFALSMKLVRTLVQGRGTLSARDFSSVVSGFCQANHKYKDDNVLQLLAILSI